MVGGSAAIPDGDDFVTGLWSKQIGIANLPFFSRPEFDKAYEASQVLPNGPERDALFDRMNRVAAAYQPYVLGVTRFENVVSHDYLKGYKPHPLATIGASWRYVDIDLSKRR